MTTTNEKTFKSSFEILFEDGETQIVKNGLVFYNNFGIDLNTKPNFEINHIQTRTLLIHQYFKSLKKIEQICDEFIETSINFNTDNIDYLRELNDTQEKEIFGILLKHWNKSNFLNDVQRDYFIEKCKFHFGSNIFFEKGILKKQTEKNKPKKTIKLLLANNPIYSPEPETGKNKQKKTIKLLLANNPIYLTEPETETEIKSKTKDNLKNQKNDKWVKGQYYIHTREGDKLINGWVYNNMFGTHKKYRTYSITQKGTGNIISTKEYKTLADAKIYVEKLLSIKIDWSFTDKCYLQQLKTLSPQQYDAIYKIYSEG